MYNYYIEMDLKNYTTIITNLSIAITFIYCIILIIDELYNIGLFSFKYTYLYNYGSFISEFNNIQTIECETNRFNLYSNDIFLYKDIFSKSYFNYLIIIAITFITILFVLAYGINFYFTFIINQPEVCSFYKSTSFIKIIMKCLCDTCHEFIPDCTGNYFISFIIIIIIPLTYFLKSFLNIDITPNSTSVLFSFGYIILFIILLFTYSFILFNINKTDNNTNERLRDVGVYIFFTIIFITSGYIYKYIYNKYTDLTLNKTRNPETFYDIYKQAPPIKPRPIQEPTYKGKNLLNNSDFKYDPKSTDIDYKQKKEIMDEYYISIRNYDKDINYYTQKYNNYINSKSKLGDTTNIINIIINILGLNNYIHLYIIALLIFVSVIYYFYNNDLLLVCVIYLICVLTILTIINAILYYNTIVNKYIIYEPQSYYKNDITNTNTKLNLLLDPSNGDGFYNILTNNQLKSKSLNLNITPEAFITNVKSLTVFENFTFSNISNINTNSSNLIIPQSDNIISPDTYTLYYSSDSSSGSNSVNFNKSNVILHIFDKIDSFSSINTIDIFNYNYNPIMFIDIYYNSNKKIQIQNLKFYNRYVYYYSYLFEKLLIKLGSIYTTSSKKCYKYQKLFNKIKNNYINYKLPTTDTALISFIDSDITSINAINALNYDSAVPTTLTTGFFNNLDNFIENNIIVVNKFILNEIYSKVITPAAAQGPPATEYYFINKLKISSGVLTFAYENNKITPPESPNSYYAENINDPSNISEKTDMIIITPKDNIFLYESPTLYVEVPLKIIDNNFNELHIKSTPTPTPTPITKVSFTKYPPKSVDKVKAYSKSIYNDSNVLYDINISTSTIASSSTSNTYFKAPYVLKAISSSSSTNSNFNQIILSSLLNNLIHITSKYEFKELKQKLYYKASPDLNINKIDRVSYSEKFTTITIATPSFTTANFLHKSSTSALSYEAYAILLYNIYTYDKNRIIDIIEYFIYKNVIYTDSIYASDEYLHEKILSIRTQIDKTVNKTELIKLYEKNRYIVNLILKIYDNLIKYIKKEIETSIDPSLCNSTSATTMNIEQQLYNHLNAYLTITPAAAGGGTPSNSTIFSAIKTSSLLTSKKQEIINNIGLTITYFFNICIFLLNNIDSGDKIEDDNKENIISNFKFYNMDDTINLEVSNLENIRRNLSINCDYYSKYNNLDKKQKLYMKINTDNVGYTFPILIIIFVVIFGETAFIKS